MATKKSAPDLGVSVEVAAASKALAPAVKRLGKILEKFSAEALPIGAVADSLYDLKQLSKVLNALTVLRPHRQDQRI
jgi:cobalamin biosynthesis protein CbiG